MFSGKSQSLIAIILFAAFLFGLVGVNGHTASAETGEDTIYERYVESSSEQNSPTVPNQRFQQEEENPTEKKIIWFVVGFLAAILLVAL